MFSIFSRRRAFPGHASFAVVGLGNPGEEYAATRHNIGFQVIQKLADRRTIREFRFDRPSWTAMTDIGEHQGLLCLPATYMNLSGHAVRSVMRAYHIGLDRVIVVCDDVHLPLGGLRIRRRGSAGGQKGLQSIIDLTGSENFPRIRCGVGPKPEGGSLADFVLSPFAEAELPLVDNCIERAADAVAMMIDRGVEEAMQEFNGRG